MSINRIAIFIILISAYHVAGRSQIQSWLGFVDSPFINIVRTASAWHYSTGNAGVNPNELDANGMPNSLPSGSIYTVVNASSQAEYPGNWLISWTGGGTIFVNYEAGGTSQSGSNASGCTLSGTNNIQCSNSGCSAPCSASYQLGSLVETASSGISFQITIAATDVGNPIENLSMRNVNDPVENLTTGVIFGKQYKSIILQANPQRIRFADWTNFNGSHCAYWADRKPTSYYSWAAPEMRSSLYHSLTFDGTATYTASGTVGTPTEKQHLLVKYNNNGASGAQNFLKFGGTSYPILDTSANANNYQPISGNIDLLTYDGDLGGFIPTIFTGQSGYNGLDCAVPPEIAVQLAVQTATPQVMWPEYCMASDPITDYTTNLATLVKNNGLHGVYENGNELTFNGGDYCFGYGVNKAAVFHNTAGTSWPASPTTPLDWLGKQASLLCQAVTAVDSNAEIIMGIATSAAQAGLPTQYNNMASSAAFTGQTAAAQPGYTKSAFNSCSSHNGIEWANYWSPGLYGTQQEIGLAFQYQTANAATQASILTTYMTDPSGYATLYGGTIAANARTWATNEGIATVTTYEGGFNAGLSSTTSTISITGATQANPVVLTATGNGAAVGMGITLSGVSGMTQLNNPNEAATFTNGSAVILATNTLRAGQAVTFIGGTVPSPFVISSSTQFQWYCVLSTGLSASQFEVTTAANCAGSGTPVTAGAGGSTTAFEGWFVSAVSTNTISLNIDGTGFSAYMSGGILSYSFSPIYIAPLRLASYNLQLTATISQTIYEAILANGTVVPAQYNLCGPLTSSPVAPSDSWAAIFPDCFGPQNAYWDQIVSFNHSTN